MIPLGLSAADLRALLATLSAPAYRMRTRVTALDLSGNSVADLTPYLDDGQVNADQSADVTRSCSLTLHDPRRALPFDTDHPADTALFLDRMVRVVVDVLVGSSTWRTVPLFTGPVTKLDRDGDSVSVEAQGKETLLLGAAWAPMTLHKGMTKTDAIARVLLEGNPVYRERQTSIPDRSARLPKAVSLTRESIPWTVARSIARSMSLQLFYDGAGVARLRTPPGTSGFSFTGAGHVTSPLQISYSGDVVNAVYVTGGTPKGSKTPVTGSAIAPASHPLSPYRIGRFLMPGGAVVADDHIKTTAEANARAAQLLADGLLQAVDVSFDAAPVWLLEPGDLCHVATDDGSVTFRLGKFSLPLVPGEAMSVGYTRRVSVRTTTRNRR